MVRISPDRMRSAIDWWLPAMRARSALSWVNVACTHACMGTIGRLNHAGGERSESNDNMCWCGVITLAGPRCYGHVPREAFNCSHALVIQSIDGIHVTQTTSGYSRDHVQVIVVP
jgi:hypothetical protein